MKIVTFSVGLAWLLYGAITYGMCDWDLELSLLMAGFTYLTADWVVNVIKTKDYRNFISAAFLTWYGCSGIYTTYFLLIGHIERMVEYQWIASLCMYLLCGVIWSCLPSPQQALDLFRAKMGLIDP